MESRFDYLLDKIKNAPMRLDPYPHLIISNFFTEEDYNELLSSHAIDEPDKSC